MNCFECSIFPSHFLHNNLPIIEIKYLHCNIVIHNVFIMRFKLLLRVERDVYGDVLPLNYVYELSALIYKTLSRANVGYASWLHENGFVLGSKKFKLFTFSRLIVPSYGIQGDRIQVKSDRVEWYITFLPEKSTEKFVQGIFSEQHFQLGDRKSRVQFRVEHVELIPSPTFSGENTFETLSPLCVSIREESGQISYLSPEDSRIKGLLLSNLLNRYKAFYGADYCGCLDFDFQLLNTPKPVLITIKADTEQQTKVKGYNCRFKLNAPEELLQIAYASGLGEKNSMGFGMIAET